MAGEDTVIMQQNKSDLTFLPADGVIKAGIIFYPGGKVEYTAYAPLMRDLAKAGYEVILLKMPFNLAVFDIYAAGRVIKSKPEITDWYVGGHSLGGSMACAYAARNADKLKGIILMASYSASNLSKTSLKVLSLYGSQDTVLKMSALDKGRALMPKDTFYVQIKGGNHSQYGDYGLQKGDSEATISRAQQQSFTVKAIQAFTSDESE
jgi:pimeloyl-ACP methyl ester carboxylesterase